MTFTKVGQSSVAVQKALYFYVYLLEQGNIQPTLTSCLIIVLTDDVLHCT